MTIEDDFLKEVHVLLHPIRYRIVELLAEKPMHINEMSNTLGEEIFLKEKGLKNVYHSGKNTEWKSRGDR
jgi:hypothetical protein